MGHRRVKRTRKSRTDWVGRGRRCRLPWPSLRASEPLLAITGTAFPYRGGFGYDPRVDPTPEKLCEALRAEPGIRFAFLFGSRASDRARQDSDWDIAVYLDESMEGPARTRARLNLAAELERFGKVDLVVLNDADPLLSHRALGGRALFIADPSAYRRFFCRTMRMAEDQRYFDGIFTEARAKRLREGTFGRP